MGPTVNRTAFSFDPLQLWTFETVEIELVSIQFWLTALHIYGVARQ